jgi:hypothetical protein
MAAARAELRLPLYQPLSGWLARLPADRFPTLDELNRLVAPGAVTGGGARLRFSPPGPHVRAAPRALEAHYEVRSFREGDVATREGNWHDLFNALAWLAFPRAKAALNRLHHGELLERGHASGARSTLRDMLTLFDEGGVIVASADTGLLELLRAFQWKTLFWERREEVRARMRFLVLGHALFEKALQPYKAVTAKALLLHMAGGFPADDPDALRRLLDERTAAWWLAERLPRSTRSLSPLPLLGIPGWADNDDPSFYDDVEVFRPGYGNRRGGESQGNAGTVGSRP